MVGISTAPPKAAAGKLRSKLYTKSFSSRIRLSCGSSSTRISRSPGTPLCLPAFPFPLIDSCIPSATPAGIFTVTTSSPYTMPSPPHSLHLFLMILPSPLQVGQVVRVCIVPKIVCWLRITEPLPLQVGQVSEPPSPSAPVP